MLHASSARQASRHALSGRVPRYIGYAIGEVVLIVVGIMIALQLNNWNEERKDRITEREMLSNLQGEFVANQENLRITVDSLNSNVEELTQLGILIHDDSESIKPSKYDSLIDSTIRAPTYYPENGVINSIIESVNLSLISNEELKLFITQWPQKFERYKLNDEHRRAYISNSVWPYLDTHYPIKNLDSNESSRHRLDIEYLNSDLRFENVVEHSRDNHEYVLGLLESLIEYQTELLEMLDEELAP